MQFFASIDHETLLTICAKKITDPDTLWLLRDIVDSFYATKPSIGLPLGNLTSQLLVNIYLNELDQFAKHELKAKYYIRYADDFVFLTEDKTKLMNLLPEVEYFLKTKLGLVIHPNKIYLKTLSSGVDFLGWVHFPDHRVLRTKTKRRVIKAMNGNPTIEVRASYSGLLKHGNTYRLKHYYQTLK